MPKNMTKGMSDCVPKCNGSAKGGEHRSTSESKTHESKEHKGGKMKG